MYTNYKNHKSEWRVWSSRKRLSCLVLLIFSWQIIFPALGLAADPVTPPKIYGFPGNNQAVAPPANNVLPSVKEIKQGATWEYPSHSGWTGNPNQLVVHQNQPKAVIEWYSFDIGQDSEVHFDQQGNSSWVALNRIYDQNPSKIFGKLTADGKVYLINQNGILFGTTAKIDVHTLVASSLNLKNDDFLKDLSSPEGSSSSEGPSWSADDYQATGKEPQSVSNQGTITAKSGGSIYLLAPDVENNGVITAPGGQIALAAGTTVYLSSRSDGRGLLVKVTAPAGSKAANLGQLIADTGLIGMYGWAVNQDGLIRATTAIKRNGQIDLHAEYKVSTGKGSITSCPISDSQEKVHESFPFTGGSINVSGLDSENPVEHIEHQGMIQAPSGTVNLEAKERVFLESGSSIEVNGVWIDKPGEDKLVEAELNSAQLRDDYGQKDGTLKGEKVIVDSLDGTSIGDISDSLKSDEKTAQERSTKGGNVIVSACPKPDTLTSSIPDTSADTSTSTSTGDITTGGIITGDIIMKPGAVINFSGGGIRYGESQLETTKVCSQGQVYDISQAPQWLPYDQIIGVQTKEYNRFGITEQYSGLQYGGASSLKDYRTSYEEGDDAGSAKIVANQLVLNGQFKGSVTAGPFQTESSEIANKAGFQCTNGRRQPKAGRLIIGEASGGAAISRDHIVDEIVIQSDVDPLPDDFAADDPIPSKDPQNPENTQDQVGGGTQGSPNSDQQNDGVSNGISSTRRSYLSAKTLNAAGVDDIEIYANTKITTEKDARIALNSGGSFLATARGIEHRGEIDVPAGTVKLHLEDNITTDPQSAKYQSVEQRLYLAQGSKILASGEKIYRSQEKDHTQYPIAVSSTSGGSIELKDKTSVGDGVFIRQGAVVDVSGGYAINADGKVTGGNAGAVEVQGSTLVLEGELKGYSVTGKKGGSVILQADEVSVTPNGEKHPPHPASPVKGEGISDLPGLPEDFDFDSPLPDDLEGKLNLSDRWVDKTGFTQVEIRSAHDLIINEGANLSPSAAKLAAPLPSGAQQAGYNITEQAITTDQTDQTDHAAAANEGGLVTKQAAVVNEKGLVMVDPEYIGSSSVKVKAGTVFEGKEETPDQQEARISMAQNSSIQVAPGGSIEMKAPDIEVNGKLLAPSGKINLTATGGTITGGTVTSGIVGEEGNRGTSRETLGLTLKSGSQVLASGIARRQIVPTK